MRPPEKKLELIPEPPNSTLVLGRPRMAVPVTGSAEPVVTRGTGRGAFLIHQSRYSPLAHRRACGGPAPGWKAPPSAEGRFSHHFLVSSQIVLKKPPKILWLSFATTPQL